MALPSILQNVTYEFPNYVELSRVESDRALVLEEDEPLGLIMPLDEVMGDAVSWYQDDNTRGLLPYKPLGKSFPEVSLTGGRVTAVPASPFAGEKYVDAKLIVAAAQKASLGGEKLNVTELLAEEMTRLQYRGIALRDYQRGQALALGLVDILDENENIVNQLVYDGYSSNLITLSGGDKWDAPNTSTPITLLRNLATQTGVLGRGFDFKGGAVALMSDKTADLGLQSAEVKAHRNQYGASVVSLSDLNSAFNQDGSGDIPLWRRVQGTAQLKTGEIKPYIPDGYVVVVGRHRQRGLRCGNWTLTSNENLMGVPGIFADMFQRPTNPRLPGCALAFHGAPKVYTNQVLVLKVY